MQKYLNIQISSKRVTQNIKIAKKLQNMHYNIFNYAFPCYYFFYFEIKFTLLVFKHPSYNEYVNVST